MNDHDLPRRLERTTIYESDYVCLYSDRVKLPGGTVIEKYGESSRGSVTDPISR